MPGFTSTITCGIAVILDPGTSDSVLRSEAVGIPWQSEAEGPNTSLPYQAQENPEVFLADIRLNESANCSLVNCFLGAGTDRIQPDAKPFCFFRFNLPSS